VKNRSSSEAKANISLESARQKESAIFSRSDWPTSSSGLLSERMGITALRTGLSNVFCAHIRAEFPAFNQQTRKILHVRRQQLESLGPARSIVKEQRKYLRSIVTTYQTHRNHLLNDDFRPNRPGDMRPISWNLGFQKKALLRDRLRNSGAVWKFQTPTAKRDKASDKAAQSFDTKTSNIYTWINDRYQNTKSCALPGIVPYTLIERLFEEQTSNWQSLTDTFVSAVEKAFDASIKHCLKKACHNKSVLAELNELVAAELRKKMQVFKDWCHGLIHDEQQGLQVVAREEQFINDIQEARTLRFLSAIARLEDYYAISPEETISSQEATKATGFGFPINSNYGRSTPEQPRLESPFGTKAVRPGGFFGQSPPTTQPRPTSSLFGGEASSTGTVFGSTASSLFSATKVEASMAIFETFHSFAEANKDKLKMVLTDDCQVIYEIHDILKAYYATAVQHYTDTVCKNGLGQAFIKETLNLFSNDFLDSLPDEEISRISAESPADRKKRRELKEDIERLETAISVSEAILKEPMVD
jgi:hypothetical protein